MATNAFSKDSPAWLAAVEFHGHACPGVAMGCRISLAAVRALDMDDSFLIRKDHSFSRDLSPDEELVCVAETDACCVDGVQALLGCTLGKGNLLLKLRGKNAMSFYYRPARKSVRILWKGSMQGGEGRELSREEIMSYYLSAPDESLLQVTPIPYAPPTRALVSLSLPCSACGEKTAEYALRLRDGKHFCLDCWPEPSRIL